MKRQTTGMYLLKDDKILFLVREKKNDTRHVQGMYLPIGGHVELGESIEECAVREVQEESGIVVNKINLRGVMNIRGQAQGDTDMVLFLFTSSDFQGEAVTGNEGHFEWVEKEKLSEINLYEGDRIFLQYLFNSQFFVLDFLYKGFELVNYTVLKEIK
jgi:8-oxo-dGTP diphosphatase